MQHCPEELIETAYDMCISWFFMKTASNNFILSIVIEITCT